MKTLQKTLLALTAGSLMTVGAQAAVSYGNGYTGQPYVGAKIGQFDNDVSGDDPTAYGVVAGYNFDPNFGMEAEYVGSDDADLDAGGDYDTKTYGAYGTYRYAFPNTNAYAKGKLGIAKTELEADFDNGNRDSVSDTGIAGGIGLGYNVNPNFGVEAEYSMMDSDADTKLMTVGANLKF
ncbi:MULTISPECIES: porin family protein [unclassified Psychrobacter]|uniref:porin family protein n=1 Tax=unclassified Psychrobacter TaxID=196806 RepID=UPI0018F74CFE|nr:MULTISPECIES: porin family protein [unclassified Psychrobacter]